MSKSNPDARQRLVAGAADLLRRRGLNATSIRELARHAKAPLGSTYHYFPGGKQQMVSEAVRFSGATMGQLLARALQAGPVSGLRVFLDLWREMIVSTAFRAGCPVLAVATEEPQSEEDGVALLAAAEVFAAWEALLADSLRGHGVAEQQAEQLATLVIAAVEGSVAMCRAERSARPLDRISSQLEALVRAAVNERAEPA